MPKYLTFGGMYIVSYVFMGKANKRLDFLYIVMRKFYLEDLYVRLLCGPNYSVILELRELDPILTTSVMVGSK